MSCELETRGKDSMKIRMIQTIRDKFGKKQTQPLTAESNKTLTQVLQIAMDYFSYSVIGGVSLVDPVGYRREADDDEIFHGFVTLQKVDEKKAFVINFYNLRKGNDIIEYFCGFDGWKVSGHGFTYV